MRLYIALSVLLQWHDFEIDVPVLNNCNVVLLEAVFGLLSPEGYFHRIDAHHVLVAVETQWLQEQPGS